MDRHLSRRRAPGWIRAWSDRELHAVALRTRRTFWGEGLSDGQEWLWRMIVSELEYRHRAALRANRRPCVCELCLPPEPDDDDGPEAAPLWSEGPQL